MTPTQLSDSSRAAFLKISSWTPAGQNLSLSYTFLSAIPDYYNLGLPTPPGFSTTAEFLASLGNDFTINAQGVVPGQFSSAQMARALNAMGQVSSITRASFTELQQTTASPSTVGQITFGNVTSPSPSTPGFAYSPGQGVGGDIWLNLNGTQTTPTAMWLMLHELGHTLGLRDVRGPTDAIFSGAEDSWLYTVMSYQGVTGGSTPPPATFMLYDIAALESMHGLGTDRPNGDRYQLSDAYIVDAAALPTHHLSPYYSKTIWDSAGRDTIDASQSNYAGSNIIDLRSGQFSKVGTDQWNIAIAFSSTIEDVLGGKGNDLIIGNSHGNYMHGGAGNDRIFSDGWAYGLNKRPQDLPPADTIAPAQPTADTIDGGAGNDFIKAWQGSVVIGGENNDSILTPNGAQRTDAGSGDDVIVSFAKIDRIDAGDGNDFVLMSAAALEDRKFVSLLDKTFPGWVRDLQLEADHFLQNGGALNTVFAALDGGSGNDTIRAGEGSDYLSDGEGSDYLMGGAGADYLVAQNGDTIEGGEGNDVLDTGGAGGVTYVFGRGSGHDVWVASPFLQGAFDDRKSDVIRLEGLGSDDIELVWNWDEGPAAQDDGMYLYYAKSGEAAVRIKDTGDTLYLGMLTFYYWNPDDRTSRHASDDGTEFLLLDDDKYEGTFGDADVWVQSIWGGEPFLIGKIGFSDAEAATYNLFEFDDGARISITELFNLKDIDRKDLDPAWLVALSEYAEGAAQAEGVIDLLPILGSPWRASSSANRSAWAVYR